MEAKKFVRLSAVTGLAIILVWTVILLIMGESSKIPTVIGGFVVGWYLRRIYDGAREAFGHDARRRADSKRGGKSLRYG